MDRPVLLCGLGKVGRSVLAVLRAAHMPVVVVDLQPGPAESADGVRYVRGDFRQADVLAEAGVRDARGVIICASDDLANLTAVLTARSLAPTCASSSAPSTPTSSIGSGGPSAMSTPSASRRCPPRSW